MKRIISTLLISFVIGNASAQILYDNGPIVLGNNFVTDGAWGRSNITYRFLNGTSDLLNSDAQNAVRQAFQIWADYGELNFTEVTGNADILISWAAGDHGDGTAFDGVGGVLGHTFAPVAANGSWAGDVHFDEAETWTTVQRPPFSGQPIDLVTVAAHEIGHALGLGHSNETCALMNPFYTGSHRYLAQDDVDGIQSLYSNRTVVRSSLECTGGTLWINHLPDGATVNWVSSNTSLATVNTVNNQGNVSWSGSASGHVRITGFINLPCGSVVEEFAEIQIGAIMASDIYGIEQGVNLSAGQILNLQVTDFADSYSWYIAGGTVIGSSDGPSITVRLDNCFPGQQAYNYFNAGITLGNACGVGAMYSEFAYAECDGDTPIDLTAVRVNQSGELLNIQIHNNALTDRTSKPEKITAILYNLVPGTVAGKWTLGAGQNQYKVNIAGLPRGFYVLQLINGSKSVNKKIWIK